MQKTSVDKMYERGYVNKGLLQTITNIIKESSKKFKVQPYDITSAQFWSVAGNKVDEWQIRKLGGFTGIRDLEFPAPERLHPEILPRMSPKFPKYRAPKLKSFHVYDSVNLKELFKLSKLKEDDTFNVLVQPDTHVPEHDEIAVNAFLNFAEWYKPHGYINLGDFLEMESVSHWEPRNAKPRRLVPEVKIARELLKRIDKSLGPQCVYKRFLMGNHEDWLDQLLVMRAPEIYDGIEELGVDLSVKGFLELKDLGYRVIPLNEILQLGELHYIHGYYANQHHAKKHLDVFGVNLCYGHLHDTQAHSSVSVKGVHEAFSSGCLRSLNAEFMKGKPNNWTHAFTIVEYRADGTFTKYVPHIIDGKFSFGGRVFNGR